MIKQFCASLKRRFGVGATPLIGAFMVAIAPASVVLAAGVGASTHTLTIQSTEQLQLSPKDEKSWHERGPWPFIGTGLTLIVTNGIAIWLIYLQSSRAFNALLRQRRIERLSASLSEFYNPLLALLDINKEIFDQTGPSSFPKDEDGRTAAALVWKETKKKILTNNAQIETILRAKTHLLEETDSLVAYHRLLVHVAMYESFQTVQTDIYQRFFFPSDIHPHVVAKRLMLLEAYNQAVGEQI